ncbi:hypothetical protein ABPG75_010891 [Micractinium tetrahymenae]
MEFAGTPGGAPAGVPGAMFTSEMLAQKAAEKQRELKDRLREFFEEKGAPFDEAWRVEVKVRATGTSLGTSDAYYFSPAGKRYRSRMEIARDFGLVEGAEPKPSGGKPRNRKSEGGGAASAAAAAAAAAAHVPLDRQTALTAAVKRREAFMLPHQLSCGVLVASLGAVRPGDASFRSADRLWPAGFTSEWADEKGVRFINSITETPQGPIFRIKAQRLAHGDKPATEIVELGAGPTPDAAYQDAEERQSEALEIALLNRSMKHRSMQPGQQYPYRDQEESPVPAGRALDAAEHLLVKCRPLKSQWGLERFGLADTGVLQAIEGLPGVELCSGYRLVDERPGGWAAETQRMNAELAARGKKTLPLPVEPKAKPSAGDGEAGGASAPRKRGPRPSRKEAEENAVRRVLDGIVRQVEMDEVRAIGLEQKARLKAEKQTERDRKRADKERMHDAMHKLKEQQRLQQRAAFMEAQRRQAELNALIEDCELPNAEEPPPEPARVATGRLPLQHQPVLLEAWQFVSRFGEPLLGLPPGSRMPTLQQLEAALLGEAAPAPEPAGPAEGQSGEASGEGPADGGAAAQPADAAVQLQMALVDFLLAGLFQGTAQAIIGANSDVSMADLRGAGRHAHPLNIKKETWQEAARRYLTVLATSAMTQAKDTGNAGATQPLLVMDPWVILQYLTAGPPSSLTQGAAALPRAASKTSGHCLIEHADAEAVAAAERSFAAIGGADLGAEAVAAQQRLLRCVLKDVIQASKMKKGDGRVLSYGGQAAAAAAKWGRPLDLRGIAARIDAGVYTALPDPLSAFAADVRYAAQLVQAGCNKQNSLYAQEFLDKSAPELSALAVSKLEQALREISVTGAADYLAQHAAVPGQRRSSAARPTPDPASQAEASAAAAREALAEPASQAAGEAGEEGTPGGGAGANQRAAGQRQLTDAVRDLDRPFAPFKEVGSWRGCVVCWSDDDPTRLLPCDTCDCQWHSYCLEPPLEELPGQTEPFLCPRCQKLQGPDAASGGKPLTVEFARASGGETAWRLAQLLATTDYSEWSVDDRCTLLRLLCTLCAESSLLHDTLHGDEEEVREKRKEIQQMRAEVKKLQAEMAAQQQAAAAAAAPPSGAAPGESSAANAAAGREPGASPAAAAGATSPGTALPPLPPQRSTRRAPDLGAEVQRMVEKISYLESLISQKGPVRLEPIGLDRHYNRYWLLPASAAASDPAHPAPPEAPPLLVIERHSLDSILPPSVAAAAAAVAGGEAVPGSSGEPGWQVGLYNSILHLQQLAQWLNPKGARERPLADYVTRLLDRHQQWAMQHAQPPRAAMDMDLPLPHVAAQRAAAVGALQAALLSFEEGNQPATYDELTGSEERRARWRAMVGAAATPQTLMRALLVLEGMFRPEFLKQQWRPFAMPAPHPDDIRTLSAVWLRLEALKACVRLKVTINMRLVKEGLGSGAILAGSGASRYSLREVKPMGGKRSYYEGPGSHPGSRADSGDSGGLDARETRAERAAKRAAHRDVPDDEAMARQLDAELNASSRRTRQQQHHQRMAIDDEDWEDDQENDSPPEDDDDDDVEVSMDDDAGDSD